MLPNFRYKLAKVTFDRTTETLQDALVEFFEQLQGIPHVLLTDNMKTDGTTEASWN